MVIGRYTAKKSLQRRATFIHTLRHLIRSLHQMEATVCFVLTTRYIALIIMLLTLGLMISVTARLMEQKNHI